MCIPPVTEIHNACPPHILQCLDGPHTLTIRLWVKSRAEVHTSTLVLVEFLLESRSKPDILFGYHKNQHPILCHDLLDIDIG